MITLAFCLLPILQATDPTQKYTECGLNRFWTQMKRGRVLDDVFVDKFVRDPNQFQALPDVELNSTCPNDFNLCILFHNNNNYPCGACVNLGVRKLFDWAKCNTSWQKTEPKSTKMPFARRREKGVIPGLRGRRK